MKEVPEIDYNTLVYVNFPPHHLYFMTVVIFNFTHPVFKNKKHKLTGDQITMEYFDTFPTAFEYSYNKAANLIKFFRGSTIHEIDPHEDDDECHIYILSKSGEIIAKIGVIDNSYRGEIIN